MGDPRTISVERPRAFTLIEMSLVVAVTAVLAISAIPALGVLGGVREASAAECVERALLRARARAMCAGIPVGVRLNPEGGIVALLEISSPGSGPTPARGVLGEAEPELDFAAAYPGVAISDVGGFAGETGDLTLWFGHDGAPQRRDSSGVILPPPTEDAVVAVGAYTVRVHRGSGAISR